MLEMIRIYKCENLLCQVAQNCSVEEVRIFLLPSMKFCRLKMASASFHRSRLPFLIDSFLQQWIRRKSEFLVYQDFLFVLLGNAGRAVFSIYSPEITWILPFENQHYQ
jgi:hypothetical protein